jgi:hypothetical protein
MLSAIMWTHRKAPASLQSKQTPGSGNESRKISRKELGKKKAAIMVACKTSVYNQQEIGELY